MLPDSETKLLASVEFISFYVYFVLFIYFQIISYPLNYSNLFLFRYFSMWQYNYFKFVPFLFVLDYCSI